MNDFPVKVQELLVEFVDILVDELPHSLPPIKSISHHIDLILEKVCQTKQHTD
jgi:hypothetical protein